MRLLVRLLLLPPRRTTPLTDTVVFGVRKIFWYAVFAALPRREFDFALRAMKINITDMSLLCRPQTKK